MVCLDSYHAGDHVLKELELYSKLVTKGSYIIVFDTIADELESDHTGKLDFKSSNPKLAVRSFLKRNKKFKIQRKWNHKFLITHNPDGFLLRYK